MAGVSGLGWDIARVVLVLVVLTPLIYYATRFYARRSGGTQRGNIRILESVSLGGHRALVLVQVEDRVLLLGVTDNSIRVLTTLSGLNLDEEHSQFASTLRGLLARGKGDDDE